jgi:hypothetical protein
MKRFYIADVNLKEVYGITRLQHISSYCLAQHGIHLAATAVFFLTLQKMIAIVNISFDRSCMKATAFMQDLSEDDF